MKKTMLKSAVAAVVAAACTARLVADEPADTYIWAGGTTGAAWNSVDNWLYNGATPEAVPGSAAGPGVSVYFPVLAIINDSVRVNGGTDGDPVVWNAADGCGLENDQARTGYIGNGVDTSLKVGSGEYLIKNDLIIGNGAGRTHVEMRGGALRTAYWMIVGNNSQSETDIVVNGGELSTAYRDGAFQDQNQGNGMIRYGVAAGSKNTIRVTDGVLRAAGSANGGDRYFAVTFGEGQRTENSLFVEGGVFTSQGHLRIGVGANSTNLISVSGGVFDVRNQTFVGVSNGSTNTIEITGGEYVEPDYFCLGNGGDASTYNIVNLRGGTFTKTGNPFILGQSSTEAHNEFNVSGGNLNSTSVIYLPENDCNAVMNVSGGEIDQFADVQMGKDGKGTLNLSGGIFRCGHVGADRWIYMGFSYDGKSEINLNQGGTLEFSHIEFGDSTETSYINLNGGTLKAIASNMGDGLIEKHDNLIVSVKEGGAVIDSNGFNVIMPATLATGVSEGKDGGLVKKGIGTLTLSDATYTGPTRVEGGTLAAGTALESSAEIVLAGGQITTSDVTFDKVTVVSGICFSDVPAASVLLAGGKYVYDASGEEGLTDGSTLNLGSKVSAAEGYVLTDCVEVSGTAFDWSFEVVNGEVIATASAASGNNEWIGASEGEWKTSRNWRYGTPSADNTNIVTEISTDATITLDADKTTGTILVNGTVHFKNSAGNPNLKFSAMTGTGRVRLSHIGLIANAAETEIASTLTLEPVITTTDSWMEGQNGNLLIVRAPMVGTGYVIVRNNVRFYGDNSGFEGQFRKDDADMRFMTPESGLPNAWKTDIYGTLWLMFSNGTIQFAGNSTFNAQGNHGIHLPAEPGNVVLEVGVGGGDVTFTKTGDGYRFYTENGGNWSAESAGCATATLRKVGDGAFVNNAYDTYNLDCVGGTTTLANDSTTVAVTVRNGATLKVAEDHTVGSVAFESGAKFVTTVSETTEDNVTVSSAACLTASGAAALSATEISTEGTTPDTSVRYPVISASSLSGSAVANVEDPDTTDKMVWLAKNLGSGVSLKYGRANPGFAVKIR